MQLQDPLAVVAPTLDAPVLAVLARAEQPFTGRQVHQLSQRGTEQGVRNALERLVRQGIVLRSQVGASYLYSLNRRHLAAPHVVALATLRDELFERWRQQIGQWPVQPRVVVLFGSAAKGDMRPESDIDLLIVADVEHGALEDHLVALQEATTAWVGSDTRILHVSSDQVTQDEAALVVAASEGIVVDGDAKWFRRLLSQQVAHGT